MDGYIAIYIWVALTELSRYQKNDKFGEGLLEEYDGCWREGKGVESKYDPILFYIYYIYTI